MKKLVIILLLGVLFFAIGMKFELPSPASYTDTKIVYQTVIKYVNKTIEVPVGQIYEKNITVHGLAVFNDSNGGELVDIDISLRAGHGGILLDVSDKTFGSDFQGTLTLIKSYAQSFTGQNLAYKDVAIRVDTSAESIQGASGSAAIVIGLIAMLQNKTLKDGDVLTGVLQPDGTFSSVNALDAKVAVAKNVGVKEFLIPKVQCSDLNETQKENISIVCVNSVQEALDHMTS